MGWNWWGNEVVEELRSYLVVSVRFSTRRDWCQQSPQVFKERLDKCFPDFWGKQGQGASCWSSSPLLCPSWKKGEAGVGCLQCLLVSPALIPEEYSWKWIPGLLLKMIFWHLNSSIPNQWGKKTLHRGAGGIWQDSVFSLAVREDLGLNQITSSSLRAWCLPLDSAFPSGFLLMDLLG